MLADTGTNLNRYEDSKRTQALSLGLPKAEILNHGVPGEPLYTTVPVPEDALNHSAKVDVNLYGNMADAVEGWVQKQYTELGVFVLPIAYIVVPDTYAGDATIPKENIIDIRPFFRTAELTLPERQAIANSAFPSVENRFLTRDDSYVGELKDRLTTLEKFIEMHGVEETIPLSSPINLAVGENIGTITSQLLGQGIDPGNVTAWLIYGRGKSRNVQGDDSEYSHWLKVNGADLLVARCDIHGDLFDWIEAVDGDQGGGFGIFAAENSCNITHYNTDQRTILMRGVVVKHPYPVDSWDKH